MRRTKIVATIGPASRELEVLKRMIDAGMDVARFNFSHGDNETHAENAERVRAAASAVGRQVAILQDLPGPKLRVGVIEDEVANLRSGQDLVLLAGSTEIGNRRSLSVSWAGLALAVEPDDVIYLADGKIRLRVKTVRVEAGEVETEVEVGGAVASRQGLNIPGSTKGLDAVPKEDLEKLKFGESIGVDLVALSFVRSAEDINSVREHTNLPLIAKIEKPQAVAAADEIIRAADCVMVARGDLGIELPIQDVPLAQKHLLKLAGSLGRPAITATQMLDSMVASPRPTRAEATDVANAIFDGTDAVMLSQESAVGQYPVETIAMMASICETTEGSLPYEHWNETRIVRDHRDPAYTIAYSACMAARDLNLAAIVAPTVTGRSARLISAHRPDVPIIALSPDRDVVRRMSLVWGVQAAYMRDHDVTETVIADSCRRVVELGWVKPGERIVVTAGLPSGRTGTTSLIQIQTV
jgi:pyruvate kinase